MTLDEAIHHCYDVANKGCDECAEEHLQLAKLLEELKRHWKFRVNKDIKNPFANISGYVYHHCDHKDEYIIEYENTGLTPNQVEQMKQENAELKRLLKLSVEDMKCNQSVCNLCKHSRSACPKHKKNFECFEWRYADKVKGMISDE